MPFAVIKRSDFSHGLVHLTRERYEYEAPTLPLEPLIIKKISSPFDVLKEILISGLFAVVAMTVSSKVIKGQYVLAKFHYPQFINSLRRQQKNKQNIASMVCPSAKKLSTLLAVGPSYT